MAFRSGFLLETYSLISAILSSWRRAIIRLRLPSSLYDQINAKADAIAKQFEFDDHDAHEAVQLFLHQMEEGLQNDGTSLSQLPTFVTSLPTGKEEGIYLALDLGGTNLRVCSVQLAGNKTIAMTPPTAVDIPIPQNRMESCTSSDLFRWIAEEILKFLTSYHAFDLENSRHGDPYRLGFSFSHAYEQQGIQKGVLIRWSKAFDIPDTVGKDVCALLQLELNNLNLPILVTALVNDTTGTLLARAYESGGNTKTILGSIFGTGTNGAYFEKLEAIGKLNLSLMPEGTCDTSSGEMIINTEWGAFDDQMILLPNTEFDQAVDISSVNPGQEMFEKRISGLYLGEILRHVILQLYSSQPRSRTRLPRPTELKSSPLNVPWEIDASFLSALATEESDDEKYTDDVVRERLKTNLDHQANFLASGAIRKVSMAIARRAARLAGVAIAAVVIRSGLLKDLENTIQPELSNPSNHELETQKSLVSNIITIEPTSDAHKSAFQTCITYLQNIFHPKSETAQYPTSQHITIEPLIDIGVTGSLWQKYPHFEDMVREVLRVVPGIGVEGEKRISIGIAGNGSLVGAALAAALGDVNRA